METINSLDIYAEPDMELREIIFRANGKDHLLDMDLFTGYYEIKNNDIQILLKFKNGIETFKKFLRDNLEKEDLKATFVLINDFGSKVIYSMEVHNISWSIVSNNIAITFGTSYWINTKEEYVTGEVSYLLEDGMI